MKPLITYVGNASDTTIRVGKYSKSFKLGQSKRVSVAVALSAVSYTHLTLPTSDLV